MNYAPVWKRALASYIDLMIALLPFCLFLILAYSAIGTGGHSRRMQELLSAWGGPALFLLALFAFLYFLVPEALWGCTPGKYAAGIRVVRADGAPCGFMPALARNIMRVVDMQFCCLAGLISILLSPRRQRLGDRLAGTVVVARDRRMGSTPGKKPEFVETSIEE